MPKILVTGGCGFIGSHLVDRLVADGRRVRVLDSLDPQVHLGGPPPHLNPEAEYLYGAVGDDSQLGPALEEVEAVVHLAASVGVGQSMYRVTDYVAANTGGTARLLERLIELPAERRPRKLVVASSMSIYGEGAYRCGECGPQAATRHPSQLADGRWEPACPRCTAELEAVPTPESKPIEPASVYAMTKFDQENLVLNLGRAYEIPAVALRFFNTYGPRQALSNPYTGVAAIFSARIRAGNPPVVYEDGRQRRDFLHVRDAVQAILLALSSPAADGRAVNVGSGRSISVLELAQMLIEIYGRGGELRPAVPGRYRQGDVRHCFADVSALRELGYEPQVELETGLRELAAWAEKQASVEDRFQTAQTELEAKGLV